MIGNVIGVTLAAFALGGAGLLAGSIRVNAATRRARMLKLATYFAIVHLFLLAALCGRAAFTALLGVVVIAGAWEANRALSAAGPSLRWGMLAAYAVLAAGSLALGITRTPEVGVYVYFIVAAFDGFSQVSGQLFGRTPLAPRISPRKTIEGSLGGALFALLAAVMLRRLAGLTITQALLACAALVPAALCGDLAASWLKRRVSIKDFSGLVPGHGGVLDRFDSLLAAAPVSLLLF